MIRIGQKLLEERIKQGLSIKDISVTLKIKPHFLEAIEKGRYSDLPSASYAQGFVRNYAEFLGLKSQDVMPFFKREFDEQKVFRVLPKGLLGDSSYPLRSFRLRGKSLLITFFFVFLLGYLFFQYRYFVFNPPLSISTPKEQEKVQQGAIVISGSTDPNALLSINEQVVSLDENGSFKKQLDVFPGTMTITVTAVNRLGKATSIERHIEVLTR